MQIDWTIEERDAIREALDAPSALRSALIKFMEAKVAEMNEYCATAMREVPRQFERAADYAAKASVYGRLTAELREAAKKA